LLGSSEGFSLDSSVKGGSVTLEEAMDLRESVDYESAYTEEDAKSLVRKAQEFLENVRRILKP